MIIKRYILLFSILLVGMTAAQAIEQVTVPWQCDFEENEDLSEWVLNANTATAKDQWMIGTGTRSTGKRSLYISTDGYTPIAGAKQNIVMAYLPFKFPQHATGKKSYDISFDWKALGNGKLYVFFGFKSNLIDGTKNVLQYASATTNSGIPNEIYNNACYVYSAGYARRQAMSDQMRWQGVSIDGDGNGSYSVQLTAANSRKEYALVFVWVNANLKADEVDMGACIDNIQIASAEYSKPTNLKAVVQCEDSSFLLTWNGNVRNYSVEYRRSNQATWRRYSYMNATPPNLSYQITSLPEGTYDFRVRGFKDKDTTAYTCLNSQSLLCMENHCINYINLDDALCTYGEYANSIISYDTYTGKIDNGVDDIGSFHTVCTDVEATDLRTNHLLKLVPDGELASVRLGTWLAPGSNKMTIGDQTVSIGGYAITYDLTVDTTTQALLLLKYAMVMENPNHTEEEQPYFRLEIVRDDGSLLDGTCGAKEFHCPDSADHYSKMIADGWQVYHHEDFPQNKTKEMGLNSSDICWKDWSTMGLNLLQAGAEQGEHLLVRVIAKGCTQSGHWGYGYFTLNCASAIIETDQCSGNPTAQAYAPEGFDYVWYALKNRDLFEQGKPYDEDGNKVIISRESELTVVAGDDQVYICRMSDRNAPDCYFELSTRLSPRMPMPMYQYKHQPSDCKNLVLVVDSARIADYGADGTLQITAAPCEYSDFTIRSLKTGKVMQNANQSFFAEGAIAGDSLEVTQTSYIADGACSNTKRDTIVIPDITTPDSVIIETVCYNTGYTFHGVTYRESDTYRYTEPNQYGCDSTEVLHLTVNPVNNITIVDTLCSTELPYVLQGKYHGETMVYERGKDSTYITTQNYQVKFTNQYTCDSIINLKLTVVPILELSLDQPSVLCADDGHWSWGYNLHHGDFDSLVVTYPTVLHQYGMQDTTIYHNPYRPLARRTEEMVYSYPVSILPDVYPVNLTFYQHADCEPEQHFVMPLDVRYASSIIAQKWNDVLSIKSEEYNGGYSFIGYQWYKDGVLIAGATNSFLYQPLDFHSEYTVQVTRPDGVQQLVCPFTPADRSCKQISTFPTLVTTSQSVAVRLAQKADITIYTLMGQVYNTTSLPDGEGTITMPSDMGSYIVTILYSDHTSQTYKVLVMPQ